MALFFKTDSAPGFHFELCNDVSIYPAVHRVLFGSGDGDAAECKAILDELREKKVVTFEDGWIALCSGMAEVSAFIFGKCIEIKADEGWADKARVEAIQAKDAAEARYQALRCALLDALADKAASIIGKALA